MPPSRAHVRAAATVSLIVFLGFLAAAPFGPRLLAPIDAFIPIVDTVLFVSDLIAATLLFAQAMVFRSRALIMLAAGYLFSALIIIPHALTFPGAFAPTGLFGAGIHTTAWIYFFWHIGLPIAVIAYAALRRREESATGDPRRMGRAILFAVIGCMLIALALTLLATAGQSMLPQSRETGSGVPRLPGVPLALAAFGLLAAAITMILRRKLSLLDLWLLVTLWTWLINIALILISAARFTVSWYSGRITGLIAGIIVLLVLLTEMTRIYGRLALAVEAQRREREGRLMSMDAVAASIAHEVKQPVAAIVTQAGAGLRWLGRTPPDLDEASASLQAIVRDGHRVGDVIGSIRAMLRKQSGDRGPLNVNDLIRGATDLMAREMASQHVSLKLDLERGLPQITADRVQMRQVLLNLLTNAIEAMGKTAGGQRLLSVRSSATSGGGVAIEVTDSGAGIDAGLTRHIFDAFFTTKADGTGMGLALCKSIVEAHGGELSAAPAEPRGATFLIRLPPAEAEAAR